MTITISHQINLLCDPSVPKCKLVQSDGSYVCSLLDLLFFFFFNFYRHDLQGSGERLLVFLPSGLYYVARRLRSRIRVAGVLITRSLDFDLQIDRLD